MLQFSFPAGWHQRRWKAFPQRLAEGHVLDLPQGAIQPPPEQRLAASGTSVTYSAGQGLSALTFYCRHAPIHSSIAHTKYPASATNVFCSRPIINVFIFFFYTFKIIPKRSQGDSGRNRGIFPRLHANCKLKWHCANSESTACARGLFFLGTNRQTPLASSSAQRARSSQ